MDVVVVGAGHAGIEAALAASALGCEVALVTTSRATIGHMPCNPAIGGTAKGHLVREIDALGGVMGQAIDATGIQFKLLNRSRGPAVWSPRAQADKTLYSQWVTDRLEAQAGLTWFTTRWSTSRSRGGVSAVVLRGGRKLHCAAVVVTTGTFLNGLTHVGDVSKPEGRYGEAPSTELAACLGRINLQTGRLKTGTPPRLDRRSIDFESSVRAARFTEERGDESPGRLFVRDAGRRWRTGSSAGRCTPPITTHDLVRRNIDDSPLYNGRITGVGPRYCPSLEDKVMRFPHRERHQLHLEPEGLESESIYVNGLSMSLPQAAQTAVVRSLPGLEDSRVIRPGYAVEYDFVQPTALTHALESRQRPGLFLAGQVNGTSGYEEAAAQGLLAGINAARRARKRSPLVLPRQESYIGILVDDLVTQGCLEPYRMFTSRAEHRLLLRIDNADLQAHAGGPAGSAWSPDERWQMFEERRARHVQNGETLRTTMVKIDGGRISAARALKRPEIRLANLAGMGVQLDLPDGPESLPGRSLEAEVKYEGYLKQERAEVRRIQRQGARRIPPAFPFESVPGLSREVVERLRERRPATLAHAARVPGVTPAALGILNGCLQRSARSASN